jgi:hypothetical protein
MAYDIDHPFRHLFPGPVRANKIDRQANVEIFPKTWREIVTPFLSHNLLHTDETYPGVTKDILKIHPSWSKFQISSRIVVMEFTKR